MQHSTLICSPRNSSTIVNYLSEKLKETEPAAAIAFFYFTFNREKMQTVNTVMRSLIIQLNAENSELYHHLYDLHKICQHDGGYYRQPRNEELEKTLMSMLSQTPSVYLVFDAVDEALNSTTDTGEEHQLLSFFERLLASHLPNVHISISSRVTGLLEKVFDDHDPIKIRCTREMVDEDIALQVSR